MMPVSEVAAVPGRVELVRVGTDYISSPQASGLLVLGSPGIGKSCLAKDIVNALGRSFQPIWVHCSPALSGLPHAALAPLLTGLAESEVSSPFAVLKALLDQCAHQAGTNSMPVLFIIEDGQYIDKSSAQILVQLMSARAAKMLFLSRTKPGPPPEIISLWSEGSLKRFDMGPLREGEAEIFCEGILKNEISFGGNAVLTREAGGNPLFLMELVSEAVQCGDLVKHGEYWVLTRPRRYFSERLQELVSREIDQLEPGQREIVEIIALADSVSLEVLQEISERICIDGLEEGNIITVQPDADRHVRISHPLIGPIIRHSIPPARSLLLHQKVSAKQVAPMDSDARLMAWVDWSVSVGEELEDGLLLRAVQAASRAYDGSYVERVTAFVKEPERQLEALTECIRIELNKGVHGSTVFRLDHVLDRSCNLNTLYQAAQLLVRTVTGTTEAVQNILKIAERFDAAIDRVVSSELVKVTPAEVNSARLGSRLLELQSRHAGGDYLGSVDILSEVCSSPEGTDETKVIALALLAETFTLMGRPLTARTYTTEAMDIVEHAADQLWYLREPVSEQHLVALLHMGDFDGAEEILFKRLEEASNGLVYFGGSLGLTRALVSLHRGKMAQAFIYLQSAIEALKEADPLQSLPLALAAASYVASALQRRELVKRYLDGYEECRVAGASLNSAMAEAYATAARSRLIGNGPAIYRLVMLADEAAVTGLKTLEFEFLRLAVGLGSYEALPRLVTVAEACEGRTAELVARFSKSLIAREAHVLMEVSDIAFAEGREGLAAECARHAHAILDSGDDRRLQRDVQNLLRRIRNVSDVTGGNSSSDCSKEFEKLTRRERDIATFVANGASNRDIAVQLDLSLRTVEGHLYRMFAKLGIQRRDQLAEIVDSGSARY